jgi:hypothetical protein
MTILLCVVVALVLGAWGVVALSAWAVVWVGGGEPKSPRE